jgi:hypothetical protein
MHRRQGHQDTVRLLLEQRLQSGAGGVHVTGARVSEGEIVEMIVAQE